jgi:hypothetical protein
MGLVSSATGAATRWVLVLGGAVVGSYGGRVAAAAMRGEPVQPLLRLNRTAVLRPDVVPGFLAVEVTGRFFKLGPWTAALVAVAGAAAAAFAEGPFVSHNGAQPPATDEAGDFGPVV